MATQDDMKLSIRIEGDSKDIEASLKGLEKTVKKTADNIEKKPLVDTKNIADDIDSLNIPIVNVGKNITKFLTTPLGAAAAGATAFAFAFKQGLNAAIQGERINKIEQAFTNLTKQVGIASTALKVNFKNAVEGMMTDVEMFELLNGSLVRLGEKAEQLPAIMELARKATDIYGGDLKNNFNAITQAIETGNTTRLRAIGLNLDDAKAADTYAKSLGVTAKNLSDVGLQQSTINALLTTGAEKFKGVVNSTSGVEDNLARMNTAMRNVGNAFLSFFEKNYAGAFSTLFESIANGIKKISGDFTASDRIKELNKEIEKSQVLINQLSFAKFERETTTGLARIAVQLDGFGAEAVVNNRLTKEQQRLKTLNDELKKLSAEIKGNEKATASINPNRGSINEDTLAKNIASGEDLKDWSKEVIETVDRTQKNLEQMNQSFSSGLSNALIDFADGTESASEAFSKFARNFLRNITEMILQQQIFNAVAGIFRTPNPAAGGGARGLSQQPMAFADGGAVRGVGTGTSDSIPARLSNGEYVLRAKAVSKLGTGFLDQLNNIDRGGIIKRSLKPNHFAEGGVVTSASQAPQVVIENKGSPKQQTSTSFDPRTQVTTIILEDIGKNGSIAKSLESTYGMRRSASR